MCLFRTAVASVALSISVEALDRRPNVLFMIGDDLNDNIGHLGHPVSRTPTMDRLASEGASFRRAYANHPICGPSRTSLLTGIYGQTTGIYYFTNMYKNPIISASKTFIEHFADNGYLVFGTGKVNHYERAKPGSPRDGWTEYGANADYSPFAFNGTDKVPYPDLPFPLNDPMIYDAVDLNFGPLSKVPFGGEDGKGWSYANKTLMRYVSEDDRDPTADEWNAQWMARKIQALAADPPEQPFLLAVGFIRPHSPNYVPDKYFDMYPLESIPEPPDDGGSHYKDVLDPAQLGDYANGMKFHAGLKQAYPEDGVRRWTQGYLAGVRATDDNFGVVLDALDGTQFKNNTIVIVTGDHGWSNGQHDWVYKNALWESTTRIPLIVRAPGVVRQPGTLIDAPVSLIDVFPTLIDLCQLSGSTMKSDEGAPLDGFSLRPLLEGGRDWAGPTGVVSTVFGIFSRPELLPIHAEDECYSKAHNEQSPSCVCTTNVTCNDWSLRTLDWRYVRYLDGSEELYHYETDPFERRNRAEDPSVADVKARMWEQLQPMMGRAKYSV